MPRSTFAYLQRCLPQHLFTQFIGCLAESRIPWVKNIFIKQILKHYKIDLSEALIEDLNAYPSFNSFFIRELKPGIRPIASAPDAIVSPADGKIAMIGQMKENQLLQAKGMYFDLAGLFGNDMASAKRFANGLFSTIYLAPHNYHRVHMPLTGNLVKTIYIPGKLFSVNRMTSELIPNLYSRNERLICLFETEAGPMAVILVGALIVGSMQTVWMQEPIRGKQIITQDFSANPLTLNKGDELGYFKMGSTVITLFAHQTIEWAADLAANDDIQVGQFLGNISKIATKLSPP